MRVKCISGLFEISPKLRKICDSERLPYGIHNIVIKNETYSNYVRIEIVVGRIVVIYVKKINVIYGDLPCLKYTVLDLKGRYLYGDDIKYEFRFLIHVKRNNVRHFFWTDDVIAFKKGVLVTKVVKIINNNYYKLSRNV